MGCGCHASGTAAWSDGVEGGCAPAELAPVAKVSPTRIPSEAVDEADEKSVERDSPLASAPGAGPVLIWNCPAARRDASAAGATDPANRASRLKASRETPLTASPTVAAATAPAEPAERNTEEVPPRSTAGVTPSTRPMDQAEVVASARFRRRRAGSVTGASGMRLRVADPPPRRSRVLEVRPVDQVTDLPVSRTRRASILAALLRSHGGLRHARMMMRQDQSVRPKKLS